jgi:ATP-dependent Zn protease
MLRRRVDFEHATAALYGTGWDIPHAYEFAKALCQHRKEDIQAVAERLLERQELSFAEVEEVLRGRLTWAA